ncbi:hypothetical protein PCE1_004630 [Barthelona sp. PCE]
MQKDIDFLANLVSPIAENKLDGVPADRRPITASSIRALSRLQTQTTELKRMIHSAIPEEEVSKLEEQVKDAKRSSLSRESRAPSRSYVKTKPSRMPEVSTLEPGANFRPLSRFQTLKSYKPLEVPLSDEEDVATRDQRAQEERIKMEAIKSKEGFLDLDFFDPSTYWSSRAETRYLTANGVYEWTPCVVKGKEGIKWRIEVKGISKLVSGSNLRFEGDDYKSRWEEARTLRRSIEEAARLKFYVDDSMESFPYFFDLKNLKLDENVHLQEEVIRDFNFTQTFLKLRPNFPEWVNSNALRIPHGDTCLVLSPEQKGMVKRIGKTLDIGLHDYASELYELNNRWALLGLSSIYWTGFEFSFEDYRNLLLGFISNFGEIVAVKLEFAINTHSIVYMDTIPSAIRHSLILCNLFVDSLFRKLFFDNVEIIESKFQKEGLIDVHISYNKEINPVYDDDGTIVSAGGYELTPSVDELESKLMKPLELMFEAMENMDRLENLIFYRLLEQDVYHFDFAEQPMYTDACDRIKESLREAYDSAKSIFNVFKRFEKYERMTFDDLPKANDSSGLLTAIEQFAKIRSEIPLLMDNQCRYGYLTVHVEALKSALTATITRLLEEVKRRQCIRLLQDLDSADEKCIDIEKTLSNYPNIPEELDVLQKYIKTTFVKSHNYIRKTLSHVSAVLESYTDHFIVPDVQLVSAYYRVLKHPEDIQRWIHECEYKLSEIRVRQQENLLEQREKFVIKIEDFKDELNKLKKQTDLTNAEAMVADIKELSRKFNGLKEELSIVNVREKIFGLPVSKFRNFNAISSDFGNFSSIWNISHQFQTLYPTWMFGNFLSLDAQKIPMMFEEWQNSINSALRYYKDNAVLVNLIGSIKSQLDDFKSTVEFICLLRVQGFRKRHWSKLESMVGVDIVVDQNLKLTDLLNLQLQNCIGDIREISSLATKEFKIERQFSILQKKWKLQEFVIADGILKQVTELNELLDEDLLILGTLRNNPFSKHIINQLLTFIDFLSLVQVTVENWSKFQANYLYLQPIFSTPDIKRQLPMEHKRFHAVAGSFEKIVQKLSKNPLIFSIEPALNANFEVLNETIEEILKNLHKYLETKRSKFPRFYFVDADGLLSILSQATNPVMVFPHLKKIFENIFSLKSPEMTAQPDRNPEDWYGESISFNAIVSKEGEVVQLMDNIRTSNLVEEWLLDLEKQMVGSIKETIIRAYKAYFTTERTQFVKDWPAMVVLVVSQLIWTQDITDAIKTGGTHQLRKLVEKQEQQINDLVGMFRTKPSKALRTLLSSLITLDVHSKDVTQDMVNDKVVSLEDFTWKKQLRYYFDEVEGEEVLTIRQVEARLLYGYEYLGNTGRLVITPLTDRCYITLTNAIHSFLGGSPAGPAGTGKTETAKQLSKEAGRQVIVLNCSEGLDHKAMGKFFKGLASCGAWAVFDEFNRIPIEVLSVIAQQILTIQMAIKAKLKDLEFEGSRIKLNRNAAIFITMNPGYAGRTELPDNLKALFRGVVMMVPDYALIAEIMLFSCGFSDARTLARKLVDTFQLSSQQLSNQSHYDFGMRAVKAVLVAAANLKRLFPDESEDKLIYRSLLDVNMPKFLKNDCLLFENIVSDLFPSIDSYESDYSWFIPAIEQASRDLGLVPNEVFVTKILQMYETILIRHGAMVVGLALSGKSSVMKVLANAITIVAENNPSRSECRPVHIVPINPKATTLAGLYGTFDPVSHEFLHGIIGAVIETMATAGNTSTDRRWVVFDGPVDALWIENMNTVLDDNKKLCLASGATIGLTDHMNVLFEVDSLAEASPATVSRCGMIYTESFDDSWTYIVDKWFNTLPDGLNEKIGGIRSVMDWLIGAAYEFVRSEITPLLKLPDLALVLSLLRVFESLVFENVFGITRIQYEEQQMIKQRNRETDAEYEEEEEEEVEINLGSIENCFLFAVVWSFGSTSSLEDREKFSEFLQNCISPKKGNPKHIFKMPIPSMGSVFDFYWSGTAWESWLTLERKKKKSKNEDFEDDFDEEEDDDALTIDVAGVLIPTTDTLCYNYLLTKLINANHPVLFVGPTGVGKSAIINDHIFTHNKLFEDADNSPSDLMKYHPVFVSLSGQTTADQLKQILDGKIDVRRRAGVFGPPSSMIGLVFVDDLNLPVKEEYGAQPPLELLRQVFDYRGYYADAYSFRNLVDTVIVSAMGFPGGGRSQISERLKSQFNTIVLTELSHTNMHKIFSTILSDFYLSMSVDKYVIDGVNKLTQASIELFTWVKGNMLPKPGKGHYLFNLRDLAKIFQGLALARANIIQEEEDLIALWRNESFRVFSDRLVSKEDVDQVATTIDALTKKNFPGFEVPEDRPIYTDFNKGIEEDRYYSQLPSANIEEMYALLEETVELHNEDHSEHTLNLVIFEYFVDHLIRVSRVLKQPRGHMLLIGVGGSSRRTVTRLAAYLMNMTLYSPEIFDGFGFMEWRDFLKDLFRACIKKKVVFLLSDAQIVDPRFLEDANNILNSGEVANLFDSGEQEEIFETFPKVRGNTRLEKWQSFVDHCKRRLHVVLCFSPLNSNFKDWLRQYPSLVNCCTIDWFNNWPKDALVSVSQFLLKDKCLDNPDILKLLGDVEVVANALVDVHLHMKKDIVRFNAQSGFDMYVTPSTFLTAINNFVKVLDAKFEETNGKIKRFQGGYEVLESTATEIASMKVKLENLKPKLAEMAKEIAILIEELTVKQSEAEATRQEVSVEQQKVQGDVDAADQLKAECERDLSEAQPLVDAALAELQRLKPGDIVELRSLAHPPAGVRLVMEAVCKIFGRQADRIPNSKDRDWWGAARAMMASAMDFFRQVLEFDRTNIPNNRVEQVRKYIDKPAFSYDSIKKASIPALALRNWLIAIVQFHDVWKVVEPKQERLSEAKAKLKILLADLELKTAELRKIEDTVAQLQQNYEDALTRKRQTEDDIHQCELELNRAVKLQNQLKDERKAWKMQAETNQMRLSTILGDCLLAGSFMTYLSPLPLDWRQTIFKEWKKTMNKHKIAFEGHWKLDSIVSNEMETRQFLMAELPADSFSIDNACISLRHTNWPFFLDPQNQAIKWLKNQFGDAVIIKYNQKDWVRTFEQAVSLGQPVILEGCDVAKLPPVFDNILLKRVVVEGGVKSIKIQNIVSYDDSFKLFMVSRMSKARLDPDFACKVSVVNFALTATGLTDQLLVQIVQNWEPQLEEKRDSLIVRMAELDDKKQAVEDEILSLILSSQDNVPEGESAASQLLKDDSLIQTLDKSKKTSNDIQREFVVVEKTSKEIENKRQDFVEVAKQSAELFFVASSLTQIQNMYQFSLSWYLALFVHELTNERDPDFDDGRPMFTIKKGGLKHSFESIIEKFVPRLTSTEKRCSNFFSNLFESFFVRVSSSLYSSDRVGLSILLCMRMLSYHDLISSAELVQFLSIPSIMQTALPAEAPEHNLLTEAVYSAVDALSSKFEELDDICDHVIENFDEWTEFLTNDDPEAHIPTRYVNLNSMRIVQLIKYLRPDKFVQAITSFVSKVLGSRFMDFPIFSLDTAFEFSDCVTPLLFLLSPGINPASMVLEFHSGIEAEGKCGKLHIISLGQGQEKRTLALIDEAVDRGHWVLLQNCHLLPSFLPVLSEKLDSLRVETTHRHFRVWLTSKPIPSFPSLILQSSVKIVSEMPATVKANMMELMNVLEEDEYDFDFGLGDAEERDEPESVTLIKNQNAANRRVLMFYLSLFHCIVSRRRNFGPLGFNVPYQFTMSDYAISLATIQNFVPISSDLLNIDFKALQYMISAINYGGRVTDDWDRRCMDSVLNNLINPSMMNMADLDTRTNPYLFGDLRFLTIEGLKGNLDAVENTDKPHLFGFHNNAAIDSAILQAKSLSNSLLSTVSITKASDTSNSGSDISKIARGFLARLPLTFDTDRVAADLPVSYENSFNTVLLEEIFAYNRLMLTIKDSLQSLLLALSGDIVLTPELEEIISAFTLSRVPKLWANSAYPSQKGLFVWFPDLIERVRFVRKLYETRDFTQIWFPGLFFPHSFLTGLLQNYARSAQIPIDELAFEFTVYDGEDKPESVQGASWMSGLFLHGARFGTVVEESLPRQLYDPMRPILFKPKRKEEIKALHDKENFYASPVYRTAGRQGTLSTTGHSTSYIVTVYLPTGELTPDTLILRGCAMLMETD